MFWKKRKFEDEALGELSFYNGRWLSKQVDTPFGSILISLEGDSASPSPQGLSQARQLLSSPEHVIETANAFLEADANAQEFMKSNGSLVLDSFSFYPSEGTFEVGFGLSDWEDAMITVVFKDGSPCEVLLAD
jgi:hypothetical protein